MGYFNLAPANVEVISFGRGYGVFIMRYQRYNLQTLHSGGSEYPSFHFQTDFQQTQAQLLFLPNTPPLRSRVRAECTVHSGSVCLVPSLPQILLHFPILPLFQQLY